LKAVQRALDAAGRGVPHFSGAIDTARSQPGRRARKRST
jgi:hypothetical protein